MNRLTDEQIDVMMGRVLQAGVIAAAALMVAGGILYLVRHTWEPVQYGRFNGVPADLKTIPGIWSWILQGHGRGLMQLGGIVMIATPVMRVIFAIYGFSRQKDGLYVAISAVVLALLGWGLFGSH